MLSLFTILQENVNSRFYVIIAHFIPYHFIELAIHTQYTRVLMMLVSQAPVCGILSGHIDRLGKNVIKNITLGT